MASEAQQLNEALQYSDSDDLVSDDEVPASSSAATVTSLSGAKEYTTNINGEGGSFMHDVHCECSEISARAFGLPCAHCGGHAEFLGITP